MGLAIGMFIAYIPLFIWMYQERRDQIKEMRKHK
jgi:hypothetical protein